MSSTDIYLGLDIGSATVKVVGVSAAAQMVGEPVYLRLDQFATQVEAVKHALRQYLDSVSGHVSGVGVTGSGRDLNRKLVGADISHTEIFAHAVGVTYLAQSGVIPAQHMASAAGPPIGTVIEIGGQDSKIIVFGADGLPAYFNMNTICSAGTGEFLKQLSDEAGIPLEEFGRLALLSHTPAVIDATCTVFSKRDFRHLTQKGVPLPDRLMGACHALVRNYMNNVARDLSLREPVFFQGGVAANAAVRQAFADRMGVPVHVTPHNSVVGALGMAIAVLQNSQANPVFATGFTPDFFTKQFDTQVRYCHGCANGCDLAQPLEMRDGVATVIDTLGGRCDGCRNPRNVGVTPARAEAMQVPVISTPRAGPPLNFLHAGGPPVRSSAGLLFAGLDGGSRGTKYALIRSDGTQNANDVNGASANNVAILAAGSIDTAGDAITALLRTLERLQAALPEGEELQGIGTTGSAGELFANIISRRDSQTADARCTEIVAHYVWASHWRPDVGTVMDIGGNDAKLIVARDGSLDFAMNDKCAAGTGSFLEAVARRFRVTLDQFADAALAAKNPVRIAGRCAVFGESDIVHKSRLGFAPGDLFLGLAHAVCRTYLSDVGRGKPLQLPIVAQGGAFLNAAVQQAFRHTLNVDEQAFIVADDPTYVLCAGALGAALLARSRFEQGYNTHFKGFAHIAASEYRTVTTTCSLTGCHRQCPGVVALLENGEPIAGYKAIDCDWGHFSGLATNPAEKEHIRAMLQAGHGNATSKGV